MDIVEQLDTASWPPWHHVVPKNFLGLDQLVPTKLALLVKTMDSSISYLTNRITDSFLRILK